MRQCIAPLGVVLFLGAPTSFGCIIDQATWGPLSGAAGIGKIGAGFEQRLAQTFTVGITGDLCRVKVWMGMHGSPTDNLVMEIRPVDGFGVPALTSGSALASVALTPAQVNSGMSPIGGGAYRGWVSFDFSSFNIAASVTDVLSFVLRSDQDFTSNINEYTGLFIPNVYAGGEEWRQFVPDPWFPDGTDFRFRTFMTPTPGALALLAMGGIATARRRR